MKRFLIAALAVLLVVGLAPSARADVIPINAIGGLWTNAVPPPPDVTINNAGATRWVRWGVTAGYGQSGYDWTPVTTPFNVNTGTVFSLGTFVHQNWPIYPPELDNIDLNFSLQIDGLAPLNGLFHFVHNETPNAVPCLYPGTPCPDYVDVTSPLINQQFQYDAGGGLNTYYFSLLGFSDGLPVNPITRFVTQEGQSNDANLYAIITTVPTPVIPEPATLLLLGSGLAGLAYRLRRKR